MRGFCLIHIFAEANVKYIPWDPPLVLHMLTSWQPAAQLVTSPHASVEVGLGSESNGQSTGQPELRTFLNILETTPPPPNGKSPCLYVGHLLMITGEMERDLSQLIVPSRFISISFRNIFCTGIFPLNVNLAVVKMSSLLEYLFTNTTVALFEHLILNIEIRTAFSRIKDSLPYTAIALQFNRTLTV